ncbi:glycoside hydrolase family 6 protein [Microbacterium sp. SORGH_AS_0969]|uniref:glycoside hydrolase family 6 protein n=1 Tax=Microbacterium sp. SORGH_AS_0969 TaxID=3041793 RepID=UPI002782C534|nr:glycoside hydrolase family 6 protein [Microbacterium sp. SORGH_AS_0969]MDQ1074326.1 endoglucanase [Microbacterium sp. SORGH_AS_0969]
MGRAHRPSRQRRRIPRVVFLVGAVVFVVALIAAIAVVGNLVSSLFQTLAARPPAVDTRIVAPDESKAAKAAGDASATPDEAAAATWLAAQPTTYWLTPEIDPVDEVWDRVAHLASEARDQDAALSVAVYGLPDRDCGNHSAGGLDPDSYRDWTARIGDALRNAPDVQKIVILEPDSIALSSSCGSPADRAGYLKTAVENVRGTNTWIYLDGGHSAWHPVDEMASLISATGLIGDVRGVALNVSNYQDTAAEFAYAHALSERLGGTHAVIDTSRNGAGPAGSEWCNPAGRLVGPAGGSFGDGVVDTTLWIKPPGESDGECNGGPPAGTWWPAAAVELTRESR